MVAPLFSDLYTVLGLRRSATPAEIRRAYRRLVLRHHPDRNPPEADAARTFQKITEAYKTLSNEQLRKEYDDQLNALRNFSVATQPTTPLKAPPVSRVRTRLAAMQASNPLELIDAQRAVAIAAAVFPFLVATTAWLPSTFTRWDTWMTSFLFGATALLGWVLGRLLKPLVQALFEFFFRLPEAGEWGRFITPFFFAALAPWGLGKILQTSLMGFPVMGLSPAVFGAGLGAWVGAAVGRAFSFAEEEPRRVLGGLIGTMTASVLASFIGFLFTAATSDVLAGAQFFSLWSCSGGAAAAGAGVSAVLGSVRKP